jgi:alkylation response protein AidB-like acyl-CoA dehydrogenase
MSDWPFDRVDASFRRETRDFVERRLAPRALNWERTGRFPREALLACGKRGYLTLDRWKAAVFAEELARCESMGVGLTVLVQSRLVGPMLEELGTPSQKRRYLKPLAAGRAAGAMAVTEPGAGSDFSSLRTVAVPGRRGFVLSGEKTYITNAAAADFLIVAARTTAGPDLTLLLVPTTADNLRITRLRSLGLATTAMGHIRFRDCAVPQTSVLGEPGLAYEYIQSALDRERLYGGLAAVAWGAHALEKTRVFLRTRRAFGRSLNRFQAVRHQMADLATSLEAARYLAYAAFEKWSAGRDATKEIAMVKLFSYRQAQRTIEACLQLHGGIGYLADHWTSRWYRDARALTIAAGTPEVMRELIAAQLRL